MKKIVAVLMGLVVAVAGFLLLFVGKRIALKPKSVAVIGGADGPTSIFIAGKISGTGLMETGAILLAAGLVIGLIAFLIIRLKRK